ncbi:MAG: hypothetical protein A2Y22_06765 [Clostridiales bacterium GWD2_32_59]|nr:MAG: hypothetical protein A2Y22_06765 [Clostridiales bacterium GWD2_32_59]
MEYVKEWLNNIAMYMVLTMFINIIIPNKAYKKYINLILGFVLIIIVLAPINKLLNDSDSFLERNIVKQKSQLDNKQFAINQSQLENQKKKAILEIFKNNVKDQIENILFQNMELKVLKLELGMNDGNENTGELESIKITVSQNKNYILNNEVGGLNKEILEKKIKILLKNFYCIDENNIYVTVQV